VLSAVVILAATASAQALDPRLAARLESAAAAGPVYLEAAVVAAIAAAPARLEEVLAAAIARAPAQRDAIAAAARRAFPGFAARIDAAFAPPAAPAPAAKAAGPVASPWSGEVEVGGSRSTGNTQESTFNAAARVAYDRRPWRYAARLDYDLANDDTGTIRNRLVLEGESAYRFATRAFAFAFASFEDDEFSGFDYRLTTNGGLGYHLVESADVTLTVEGGPGLRLNRIAATDRTETEAVGRLRAKLSWQISETTKFAHETSAIVGAERTTLSSRSELTSDIAGPLALRLSFELRHDTSPPPDTQATDTVTKASLVYRF